jgi:hypothetical protein
VSPWGRKRLSAQISTVCVEKHPPFRQHPAWILALVSVLTPGQMDGSLDFSFLLRDAPYAERKRWACPGDLNRCMRRSRWRVGWCEFSARLLR